MKRREFVALVGGAAIPWPISARAQTPPKRLGILQGGRGGDTVSLSEEPFLSELAKLGYVEGRNLIVERRYAEGKLKRRRHSPPRSSPSGLT